MFRNYSEYQSYINKKPIANKKMQPKKEKGAEVNPRCILRSFGDPASLVCYGLL